MLEGLEAVEIRRSSLNEELRYEAEFFRKRYLEEDAARKRWPTVTLGEIAVITDGPHGYHVVDPESDVVMLTAKNAKNWFTDREGADPLARHVHEKNLRSSLDEDDVVLSTRGTVGCCALVTREVLPANLDQDVARVGSIDRAQCLPTYVAAYLNSAFGQDHMQREASGMVQQGLSLSKVRAIPVPRLSEAFQRAVDRTVRAALQQRRAAAERLAAAELALLDELGLRDWNPPEALTYTRSAAVVLGGRFDAEFHQPCYDALVDRLASQFTLRLLGDMGEVLKGETVPYVDDGSVPIIRSGDLRDIDDDASFLRAAADTDIFELRRGDILISSIGFGSIGKVQVFDKPGRYGTVGEVTVVRQKELNPYYIAAFLRSRFGQMMIERYITGATGQLHLYAKDVAKIPIPKLTSKQQAIFEQHAKTALGSKLEARSLLACTQRAVEIAIAEGEAAALKLLT